MALPGQQSQTASPCSSDRPRTLSGAADIVRRCSTCERSFRSCECKACSKCGSLFQKYSLTGLEKGRSHCRLCFDAVCATCHILADDVGKVCTRCQLAQKETQVSRERALKAIDEAKYGKEMSDGIGDCSLYNKLKLTSHNADVLFEAAKNGDHHILVTLLDIGANANLQDDDQCTPLYFASERGHLTTVALLLERGASLNIANVYGLTCLHAVAWKASSEKHLKCAALLLEEGADPLAENDMRESPLDVAIRCDRDEAIVSLLKEAAVNKAVEELSVKLKRHSVASVKDPTEQRLWRSIATVVHHASPGGKGKAAVVQTPLAMAERPADPTTAPSYASRAEIATPPRSPRLRRPVADVVPIIKPAKSDDYIRSALNMTDLSAFKEQLEKCAVEKKSWEDRCRALMQSLAAAAKEQKRIKENYESRIVQLEQEKTAELLKAEAAFANKLAKVRQEAEINVRQTEALLASAEEDHRDLFQLQRQYRLTWVPDELVVMCQNPKCRVTFSKTNRKHHCRCCGRIFCQSCSSTKARLSSFGYPQPVRLCSSCFALVDDVVAAETNAEHHRSCSK